MPNVAGSPPSASPDTLPQELRELAQELSVAVHKRGIYPASHPMQLGAVEAVLTRLEGVLRTRSELAIGVARSHLLLDGIGTDPNHPLLHELASRMHDHQLGGVRFLPGISRAELDGLLAALAESPLRGGSPLGARDAATLSAWPHLAISPLAFEQLTLLEDDPTTPATGSGQAPAAQLWGALARVALSDPDGGSDVHHPGDVAASIERRLGASHFDEHLSGLLLQAVGEIGPRGAAGEGGLRQQMTQLVEHLSEPALQHLLEMGGNRPQRAAFLERASDTLGAQAVLELVRVAAAQDGAPISSAVLRLLRKLAREASSPRPGARGADVALRRVARRLLRDWTLDDPNPEAYSRVLTELAADGTVPAVDRRRDALEPERLIEISLHVGVIAGSTESALGRLVMRDGVSATLERLEALPPSEARESLVGRLINESTLREQLAAVRPDLHVLAHAVDRMRTRAVAPLVQAMEAREDTETGWGVTLLARLGLDVLEPLGELLPRLAPRALRQVLLVFDRLDAWPPGVAPAALARHADASVRREAIRYLLRHDGTREAGVLLGLRDPDVRAFSLALHVVMRGCSVEAARALMRRYEDESLGAEMRARLVRVIATVRTTEALDWLCAQVLTTRWFMGTLRLRKPSLEVTAIVTAIAQHYPHEPAAAPVLRLAERSRDDATRRAARIEGGVTG